MKTASLPLIGALLMCLFGALPALVAEEPVKECRVDAIKKWSVEANAPLVEIYREFHAAPELSFHEEKTALRLAAFLKEAGFTVTTGIGGHGVVAILENGAGPTVMLRTDLDALPVTEKTELTFASTVTAKLPDGVTTGVMHACGHDMHITNVIGVSRFMATHKDWWKGTLMVIGQPAEEKGAGSKAMLDDGLFTKFQKPDFALALHVDPTLPAGTVGYRGGYAMANVDSVDIIVKGKGGHGAYPHMTVDPIVQASQLVLDLQTIVSREVKPADPAVITVGSIHGGTKHNVIGDTCHLALTVRSYGEEVRQQLLDAIQRKANSIALSHRAEKPEITISEGTPSLFNDQVMTQRIAKRLDVALGGKRVVPVEPSMGGEDFSRYGIAGVPIFMFRLGAIEVKRLDRYKELGQQPPSLHSPHFYPDAEPVLKTAVTATVVGLLELFQPLTDDAS